MSPVSQTSTKAIQRRGLMLVISSPSGAGKSTIARNLLESDPHMSISVSVTTRKRRPSEIDGRHYFFKSIREFEGLRQTDALLEWAEVHGNSTARRAMPSRRPCRKGRTCCSISTGRGAQQLQEKMGGDVVSIFILPPTMAELQSRLHRRAEDTEEVIATRLANSRSEIEHWLEYDYIVVNEDLDSAFASVQAIVEAERLRRDRRPGLFEFVNGLLTETPKL